jgi:hypothetical protein
MPDKRNNASAFLDKDGRIESFHLVAAFVRGLSFMAMVRGLSLMAMVHQLARPRRHLRRSRRGEVHKESSVKIYLSMATASAAWS